MTFMQKPKHWIALLLLATTTALHGCDDSTVERPNTSSQSSTTKISEYRTYAPVTVNHNMGTTVIERLPQRVVALDMNEVDFLDLLGIPVAGMPKDFIPHFLAKYKERPHIQDTGAIVQPNLEKVHAAKPDLILITSLQASHYEELSLIAPTIHFDVNYHDSQIKHLDIIKNHLITLGRVFEKEELARQAAADLASRVEQARQLIADRPEKALIVLHNNGAFRSFGPHSRYGFIFNELGVKPAALATETGLHGHPISSEFIQQANPDVIYVVDRTAVMEHRPALNADTLGNPLLRQTNAWKNGHVVFADAQAWYVTAASVNSIELIIDDVVSGYRD